MKIEIAMSVAAVALLGTPVVGIVMVAAVCVLVLGVCGFCFPEVREFSVLLVRV